VLSEKQKKNQPDWRKNANGQRKHGVKRNSRLTSSAQQSDDGSKKKSRSGWKTSADRSEHTRENESGRLPSKLNEMQEPPKTKAGNEQTVMLVSMDNS
jgi:hypothetical protein